MKAQTAAEEQLQTSPARSHQEVGTGVERLVIGRDRRKRSEGPIAAIVEISARGVAGRRSKNLPLDEEGL